MDIDAFVGIGLVGGIVVLGLDVNILHLVILDADAHTRCYLDITIGCRNHLAERSGIHREDNAFGGDVIGACLGIGKIADHILAEFKTGCIGGGCRVNLVDLSHGIAVHTAVLTEIGPILGNEGIEGGILKEDERNERVIVVEWHIFEERVVVLHHGVIDDVVVLVDSHLLGEIHVHD